MDSSHPAAAHPSQPWLSDRAEAAFAEALAESLARLELRDHNLLCFHHVHGLGADELARVLCRPRAWVLRQLDRVRARLLRELRRGLAARLALERGQLDELLALAQRRLAPALARALRA